MIEDPTLTAAFRALADPTRRALFQRIVAGGEVTVAALTQGSGVTQGAVSQHLKALKGAGLVDERPEGRRVHYRVRPEGLRPVSDWLVTWGRYWSGRVDDLDRLLRAEAAAGPEPKDDTP